MSASEEVVAGGRRPRGWWHRAARRWGMGLAAVGIAIMVPAWWTHEPDGFMVGFCGFCLMTIGVITISAGSFYGTLRSSIWRFLAILVAGAAAGGIIWRIAPHSNVGALIGGSIGVVAALMFLMSIGDRSPQAFEVLKIAWGLATVALGIHDLMKAGGDHGALLAAGLIFTACAIGMRSPGARPVLARVGNPLGIAATVGALVCLVAGYQQLLLPCLMMMSVRTVVIPTANSRAPRPAAAN